SSNEKKSLTLASNNIEKGEFFLVCKVSETIYSHISKSCYEKKM
ncbi:7781_t:CDS:1, partial [Dentiscutata erythropus]